MLKGKVISFDAEKGCGFIRAETGHDVFVHYRDIVGDGRQNLEKGEVVTLVVDLTSRYFKAFSVERRSKRRILR